MLQLFMLILCKKTLVVGCHMAVSFLVFDNKT